MAGAYAKAISSTSVWGEKILKVLHSMSLPSCDFLTRRGRLPADLKPHFKGHAYLLYQHAQRELIGEGVVLIGDAAGLACTQSGEGIRPAVESGLLAATTILQADGRYSRAALDAYTDHLTARFGARDGHDGSDLLPANIKSRLAGKLMTQRWFVQNIVLDRWFLRTQEPPLQYALGPVSASRRA